MLKSLYECVFLFLSMCFVPLLNFTLLVFSDLPEIPKSEYDNGGECNKSTHGDDSFCFSINIKGCKNFIVLTCFLYLFNFILNLTLMKYYSGLFCLLVSTRSGTS